MPTRTRTAAKPVPFDRSQDYGARRAVILAEAARQFNARGFALCSIDDIAERLRITKPAIYYYFRNKQQLLYECYVQAFDAADDALSRATAEGRTGRERLELYVRAWLLNGLSPDAHIVPLREQRALQPALRQKLDRRRRARRDRLRALVAEGIADGSIRPCEPKVVVSAWAGAVAWILESYDPTGPLKFEQVAEELIALLLRGLAT
ncbi:TetR/AcrR family transcriptional regulator [Falsiroseomonas sp. CW058]|uniref:TetR/AcrR family transcriptional regulator n=1 Tax=Falsiroseomonas sp. CW058 TaxID=3388664 RepID=UPI003D313E1D